MKNHDTLLLGLLASYFLLIPPGNLMADNERTPPTASVPSAVTDSSKVVPSSSPDAAATEARTVVPPLLSDSRAALKEGDYDRAARNLKEAIARSQNEPELLGQAYLLIVNTYVQRGNYYKNEPQGREVSELFYKEAGRYVGECLSHTDLRHVRPEPATRFPPEMLELFRRTREQMFGSLRIVVASPRDAGITLDSDTLYVAPGDSAVEAADLTAGLHQIRITHEGYKDLREGIRITAGSTTERTYTLARSKSLLWYAGRASLGVGGAVAYIVTRKHSKSEPPAPPVDGPPDWPR